MGTQQGTLLEGPCKQTQGTSTLESKKKSASTAEINAVAAITAGAAPEPITGTVQAIGSTTVASIAASGPTPRIATTLDSGMRIDILPDSGSCINLVDKSSLKKWNVKHQEAKEDDFWIFNVSGDRIPIIGTATFKVNIENSWKNIHALVTENSPLADLLVGWKTLAKWGIFKITVNSIGPQAIHPNPATAVTVNAIGAPPTFSSTLPHTNRAFLTRHKEPIKRTFPMPVQDDRSTLNTR